MDFIEKAYKNALNRCKVSEKNLDNLKDDGSNDDLVLIFDYMDDWLCMNHYREILNKRSSQ